MKIVRFDDETGNLVVRYDLGVRRLGAAGVVADQVFGFMEHPLWYIRHDDDEFGAYSADELEPHVL